MDDSRLIQIIDAAMAEAARRSGDWLACRPGCTQCCVGAFAISRLDAERLRRGMARLDAVDPERGARVRRRAAEWVERQRPAFPGDIATGMLYRGEEAEAAFEDFANDEPCPALDRESGLCDLYAERPLTCRTFGPAVRLGPGAVGACELCYQGATDEEIAACEVTVEVEGFEDEVPGANGAAERTVVAFALIY